MKKKLVSVLLALVVIIGVTALAMLGAGAEEATAATHSDHCVCGGAANGVGDHTCGEALTGWTALNNANLGEYLEKITYTDGSSNSQTDNKFKANGCYYLTEDVNLSNLPVAQEIHIFEDQEITICLNGHTLTGRSDKRIFRVNGTLNITDCSTEQTGKIKGGSSQAPVFYAYSGSEVNLYAGELSSAYKGTANYWGGVCTTAYDYGSNTTKVASSFNMYGGKIIGHDVVKDADGNHGNGGALQMFHNTNFNMYGGEIVGAHAENSGGAIHANTTGTVNLLGGKITGGTADSSGGDVYLSEGAVVTVGNDIVIGDLYVAYGNTIATSNLTGSIGLSTHYTYKNAVVSAATEAEAACFTNNMVQRTMTVTEASGKYEISFTDGHKDHCVCGGELAGVGDHTQCEDVTWQPLTAEDLTTDGWMAVSNEDEDAKGRADCLRFDDDHDVGCYYLTENITLTTPIEIHSNDQISICLNGYKLAFDNKTQNRSVFRVWGKLDICDCTGKGQMTSDSTGEAGMFYVLNGNVVDNEKCELNIYGGTFTMTDTNYGSKGGLIHVGNNGDVPGIFNLYGGRLSGGKGFAGGNVFVEGAKGAMNMYGGTISGGMVRTATQTSNSVTSVRSNSNRGGNVYVNKGAFNMYGGVIEGGSTNATYAPTGYSVNDSYGADIYQYQSAVLLDCPVGDLEYGNYNGSYTLKLGENFRAEGTITCDSASASSTIVGSGAVVAMLDAFVPGDAENDQLVYADSRIFIRPAGGRWACHCGGSHEEPNAVHNTCSIREWAPFDNAAVSALETYISSNSVLGGTYYTLPAGSYYLTEDLDLQHGLYIAADTTVYIDLNGYEIVASENAERAILTYGDLYICDSSYDASAETVETMFQGGITGKKANSYATMYIAGSSETRLFGGHIYSSAVAAVAQGPVGLSGKLYLFHGTITGTEVTGNGGAVAFNDSGNIAMYNGKISGGKAKYGGSIYMTGASQKLDLNGGEITGGEATAYGGNIYNTRGTINLNDGAITDGYAAQRGGNIYLSAAVTVSSDKTTATLYNGKLNVKGGVISGGSVSIDVENNGYGGNIASSYATGKITTDTGEETKVSCSQVSVTGGQIIGGIARSGGNIYSWATLTIEDGLITDGEATSAMGGNIRMEGAYASLSMTGGKVTLGQSKSQGGNIVVRNNKAAEISGGEISGGHSGSVGGNIYNMGGNLTISGTAVITNGTSTTDGGNIGSDSTVTISGGTISDGETTGEGGNIYTKNLTMTGGTVSGGTSASYGGNIYITGESTISGGTVEKGISTSTSRSGGNICVTGGELTVSGDAVISGGKAWEGGNISMRQGGTVNISGGTIEGGQAGNHGGNIVVFGTLNVSGGQILNGIASVRGGNISGFANTCNINITGGQILNGIVTGDPEDPTIEPYGANVVISTNETNAVSLTITGGTISGTGEGCAEGVYSVHVLSTGTDITATVGGTAQIDSLRLGTGRMLTIAEGGFSEGASIGISRFEIADVFAPAAAADYTDYFTAITEGTSVKAVEAETGYDLILVSENPYWAFDYYNDAVGSAATIDEAAALEGAAFVRLVQDTVSAETVTGNVILDLYGNDLSGITISGTIYGMDFKTNSYTADEYGVLSDYTLTGTGKLEAVFTNTPEQLETVRTYVAIPSGSSVSFHRVYVSLTSMSLKPDTVSFGYSASFYASDLVKEYITGYGYNMWVNDGTAKQFAKTNESFVATEKNVLTLRVNNILSEGNDALNAIGSTASICGNAFITLNFGGEEVTVTSTDRTNTLKDAVEAIDAAVAEDAEAYSAEQMEVVKAMCEKYQAYMTEWATSNITAWGTVTEETTL